MKNFKVRNLLFLLFSVTLFGCNNNSDAFYNEAIDNGIEYFEEEEYDKAISYFEIAVDEKPNDEYAQALLSQMRSYKKALDYLEEDELEEALAQAEKTSEITNGSEKVNEESNLLMKEIQEMLEARETAEEETEDEEHEVDQVSNENVQASETAAEDKPSEAPYEYSDFIGYYLHFDSEDHTHADMITTIGYGYLTVGWYLSNFELYNVLDTSVEENILSVDYSIEPYGGGTEEYGTFQLFLHEEDGEKYIEFESGMIFHEASYEEVLDYGYSIQDFLYEDMGQ